MTVARALGGLGLVLLVSCGSSSSTCPPRPASCAALLLQGHRYDAYRVLVPPPGAPSGLQEVGDATYPACNSCRDRAEGFGSTDVWHVPGVGIGRAVLGYRQGSESVFVLYVRRGVDPATLRLRSWAASG